MGNIITYTQENLKTFEEKPFTEADSLVLSSLSYMYLPKRLIADDREYHFKSGEPGIKLKELYRAEYFSEMFDRSVTKDDGKSLLASMCASPRFRDIKVRDYVDIYDKEIDAQFSAMTFELAENQIYVSFRGTDITLTGWKENINMGRENPVTSQIAASVYLTKIAKNYIGRIFTGGHSKGGNLAVYAAANLTDELQDKIETVFDHDGPGFTKENISEERFRRIEPKVRKTVPGFSVVGMIFNCLNKPRIVKSDNTGIMQHYPFSWIIEGEDFQDCKDISAPAKFISEGFNSAAADMTEKERENFTIELFNLIDEKESTDDLKENVFESGVDILKKFSKMDDSAKGIIMETLGKIAGGTIRSIPGKIFGEKKSE